MNLSAVFKGYNRGEWEESFEISLKDLNNDINLVIEKFNKIKEENRLKAIENKAKAEKEKQEYLEAEEFALYEKLKAKFENR